MFALHILLFAFKCYYYLVEHYHAMCILYSMQIYTERAYICINANAKIDACLSLENVCAVYLFL